MTQNSVKRVYGEYPFATRLLTACLFLSVAIALPAHSQELSTKDLDSLRRPPTHSIDAIFNANGTNEGTNSARPLFEPRRLFDVPEFRKLDDGVCMDREGHRRPPVPVSDIENADPGYVHSVVSCRKQTTCLSEDRLRYLEQLKVLPLGLKNTFQALDIKDCSLDSDESISAQIDRIASSLLKSKKLLPHETLVASRMSLSVSKEGRTHIAEARAAQEILAKCYRLDADFEKRPDVMAIKEPKARVQLKRSLYEKSELRQVYSQPVCYHIWSNDDLRTELQSRLTQYRRTLFSLEAVRQREAASENVARDIVDAIADQTENVRTVAGGFGGRPIPVVRPQNLIPYLSVFYDNPIFKGGPKEVERLTDKELAGLNEFNQLVGKVYPTSSMYEGLRSNLNRLLSRDPILSLFKTAQVTPEETAQVFELYATLMPPEQFENEMADFAFYDYPLLVDDYIGKLPAEDRGDACAIADYIHRRSIEIIDESFLAAFDVTLIAGAGAVFKKAGTDIAAAVIRAAAAREAREAATKAAAKETARDAAKETAGAAAEVAASKATRGNVRRGVVGYLNEFLHAGALPGMAGMVDRAVVLGSKIGTEGDVCRTVGQRSREMCRAQVLNRAVIDQETTALTLAFTTAYMKLRKMAQAAKSKPSIGAGAEPEVAALPPLPSGSYPRVHKERRKKNR